METDKGKGDLSTDLADIFSGNQCVRRKKKKKREECKESGADLDGGDCNVEREISDPKDIVSLAA